MKTAWGGLLIAAASLASGLVHAQDYYDDRYSRRRPEFVNARVLDIRAVYDAAGENCWDEPVAQSPKPAPANSRQEIVGGVVGGVIAKPSAKGADRFAPTAAGAALGEAIAREDEQRRRQREYFHAASDVRYQRRCESARSDERVHLLGYEVTFDYDGYTGQVFSERRPGRRIRVSLDEIEY